MPLVPVTLVGPGGRLRVNILLDSGAEVTILPGTAARLLRLPSMGPGPGLKPILGETVSTWQSEVTIDAGDLLLTVPCLIPEEGDPPPVWGRLGLFDSYKVSFLLPEGEVEILPLQEYG